MHCGKTWIFYSMESYGSIVALLVSPPPIHDELPRKWRPVTYHMLYITLLISPKFYSRWNLRFCWNPPHFYQSDQDGGSSTLTVPTPGAKWRQCCCPANALNRHHNYYKSRFLPDSSQFCNPNRGPCDHHFHRESFGSWWWCVYHQGSKGFNDERDRAGCRAAEKRAGWRVSMAERVWRGAW